MTHRNPLDLGGDPPCWAHLAQHRDGSVDDAASNMDPDTDDAVIVADPEGRITHWNEAATQLFGHSPRSGESLDIIIPERFRERHWAGYRRAMSTGNTQHGDELLHVPALHADGSWVSVEFSVVLLYDAQHDQPVAIAATLRRDRSRPALRRSEGDPEQT